MQSGPHIGEREREILTAIVETFIATGEPVGSRTLARANREGLSSATIRKAKVVLPAPGVATARKSRGLAVRYLTNARRCQPRDIAGFRTFTVALL